MSREHRIIDISRRLQSVYKLRCKLIELYADDLNEYLEANELLLNVEDDLWNEVDSSNEEN